MHPGTRSTRTARSTRTVVIVTYPGIQSLDAVGPFEVFSGAGQVLAAAAPAAPPAYAVRLVSVAGGSVATESGLTLGTDRLPLVVPSDARGSDAPGSEAGPIDTLLIAGGLGVQEARRDATLIDWLRQSAPHARRLGTVCTGAFLAAEAGLLDGHPVTTHWARAEQFAEAFPELAVDADPIFTRSRVSGTGARGSDGREGREGRDVWTSAGVTAGIDMALAMVEDDHGTEVAQTVARWLVMFLRRPGGQTQFAAPVWMPRAERSSVRAVQQAIERDPADDHRIAALARRAAMSPRHFSRVFADEVGEPPGQYVERVRVEAARRMLEDSDDTVAAIARRCGFGAAETMRRSFVRRLGVAPDHYRRRFGSAA